MRDEDKSRELLIAEVSSLRHRVAELESLLRRAPTGNDPAPAGDGLAPATGKDDRGEDRRAHLAAILEATPDMVSTADLNGRILYFNRAAREILGVGDQEQISKRTIPQGHPDWAEELIRFEGIPTALREGAWLGETAVLDREGREIPVSQVILAHGDREGTVRYLSTIARDISREKQAEERERARRELLDAVLDLTAEGIILTDEAGNFFLFNRRMEEITGYSKEDAQRSDFPAVLYPDPDYRARAFAAIEAALRGEHITDQGWEIVRKDGEKRTVLISTRTFTHGDQRWLLGTVMDVTDCGRTEKALRESERRMRLMADSLPALVFYLDTEGRYRFVNRGYEEWFGLSREDVLGKSSEQVLGTAAHQTVSRYLEAALAGQPVAYEILMPYRHGGDRYIRANLVPHLTEEGTVAGIYALVTDITERKRAELDRERLLGEIDAQRRLLEAVVAGAPIGIAVLRGPDLVYELVNPTYRSLAPGKEMLGRPLAEVWPEMAEQALPSIREILRVGEPHHSPDAPSLLRRAHDGALEERYFTFDGIPLGLSGKEAEAVLVMIAETTEQVRSRRLIEELAETAGRRAAELQSVLDNMVDAVFVSDARGQITMVNQAAVRLLGLDGPREALRPVAELRQRLLIRHPDGQPFTREDQVVFRALAGETVEMRDSVVRSPRTGRDVHIRASASPIRNERGEIVGAVSVSRDVTELTELDRLKQQLISVAAHELKTPVAIMKGYAQLLLRKSEEIPPPLRRMLRSIEVGADRIDRTVQELLDISRLQEGRLELSMGRVDLLDLVRHVVDQMSLLSEKHRVRIVEWEPVAVRGDRDRLEQVLVNLIDNALRYSPGGGDVDVRVSLHEGSAVVSVADHGVGIPEDKQSRLFQRFYRAHTNTPYDYGGMGVGLYISREIAALHGGTIGFASEEGKGSTFSLSLPA